MNPTWESCHLLLPNLQTMCIQQTGSIAVNYKVSNLSLLVFHSVRMFLDANSLRALPRKGQTLRVLSGSSAGTQNLLKYTNDVRSAPTPFVEVRDPKPWAPWVKTAREAFGCGDSNVNL